jgi:hypothetical protein
MKKYLFQVFLVIFLLTPAVWAFQSGFSGLYRYKAPYVTGMKYDPGNDSYLRIEIGEKPNALYVGLDCADGEHGICYIKTEVSDLAIKKNGDIEFTLGYRNYFSEPFDEKNGFNPRGQEMGSSDIKLYYKGKIEGDNIILTCTSEYHSSFDCPAKDFIFERVKESR